VSAGAKEYRVTGNGIGAASFRADGLGESAHGLLQCVGFGEGVGWLATDVVMFACARSLGVGMD
jgi:hypothetical protein